MYKLLLFSLFIVGFSACTEQSGLEETFNKTAKKTKLINANNKFAFDFFKEISINEEENFMVSPVSLSLALGMLYNGAEGTTKEVMGTTLGFSNFTSEELSKVNYEISNALEGGDLQIANSNWIDKNFIVKQKFIDLNQTYYNAEIKTLDFQDTKSTDIINKWVSDKTHQKITKIIDRIPESAVMYLINAIYFNANWKYEFDPKNTSEQSFYPKSENSKMVKMMSLQSNNLKYLKNELFQSVILPYKGNKYSMTLLLPNPENELSTTIESLNAAQWKQWQNNYSTKKLGITLPKFKFEYENVLNNELTNLGLGTIFENPNLNGISNSSLAVSKVLQKTYIDVNEEGTEAAAVTSIEIETTSAPSIPFVIFNRPFLFVITEKETGSICFIGKVGSPDYQ